MIRHQIRSRADTAELKGESQASCQSTFDEHI